jgi:hypothetical protein
MVRRNMSKADAAELVLQRARRPLHRARITDEIIHRGYRVWGAGKPGKTPEESVGRALTQKIAKLGEAARFDYVNGKGSGMFDLRRHRVGHPSIDSHHERMEYGAALTPVHADAPEIVLAEAQRQLPSRFTYRGSASGECEVWDGKDRLGWMDLNGRRYFIRPVGDDGGYLDVRFVEQRAAAVELWMRYKFAEG